MYEVKYGALQQYVNSLRRAEGRTDGVAECARERAQNYTRTRAGSDAGRPKASALSSQSLGGEKLN